MTERQTLNSIKTIVLRLLPGSEVFLFGSRAKQTESADSDYDILIITDREIPPSDKMPFRTKIRKLLLSKGVFSDILIQSKQEVETRKQLTGHIVKTILAEGIKI